jgi:hypothetical protein
MEIRVDARNVELPARSSRSLATRIGRLLSRLRARISRVHITLKDVNGPRGGRDKVCVLRTELTNGRQIVVVDRSAKLGRAIVRSVRRSRLLIDRESKRRRDRLRAGTRTWAAPVLSEIDDATFAQ